MIEFYNDEYFDEMIDDVVNGSNKNFELFRKNAKNVINDKTLKKEIREGLKQLFEKIEEEREKFKNQYKMSEFLINFLLETQEPERSLLEEWFYDCCNCPKEEFKEIEGYTNDFLNENSYSRHSIRKIMNSIKQYRGERGL